MMGHQIRARILLVALVGLSGCTFEAVKLTSESKDGGEKPRRTQAVAEVYADPQPTEEEADVGLSVTALAKDLQRTGLFRSVVIGPGHKDAALSFVVRSAEGVRRCGTPHVLSAATLGFWHDSTQYSHLYDFTIRNRKGESIEVKKEYEGEVLSGLLALPIRASRNWSAPSHDAGAAAVVVDALRRDLEVEPLITSLEPALAKSGG
jgi:hypothetical protein